MRLRRGSSDVRAPPPARTLSFTFTSATDGGRAGGGGTRFGSSLTSLFPMLTSRGPTTSALMDAGDWDAVMIKMEEKAARAEEWEAAAAYASSSLSSPSSSSSCATAKAANATNPAEAATTTATTDRAGSAGTLVMASSDGRSGNGCHGGGGSGKEGRRVTPPASFPPPLTKSVRSMSDSATMTTTTTTTTTTSSTRTNSTRRGSIETGGGDTRRRRTGSMRSIIGIGIGIGNATATATATATSGGASSSNETLQRSAPATRITQSHSTPAIRQTSSTFNKINFLGQNFLQRTLVEYSCTVPAKFVRRVADMDPDCVCDCDFCGNSALHVAANEACAVDVLETLLECRLDVAGWANAIGRTPLHLAAAPLCQMDAAFHYRARGHDNDHGDENDNNNEDGGGGNTNKAVAKKGGGNRGTKGGARQCRASVESVATIFLAHPSNIVKADADGRTPLELAMLANSPPAVRAFLAERSEEFERAMVEAELELECMAENDEIDIPREGLTLAFIANHVNKTWGRRKSGYMMVGDTNGDDGGGGVYCGWKKGLAAQIYGLNMNRP